MNANPASTPHCRHDMTCIAEAGSRFTQNFSRLLACLGFAAFVFASAPALAQTAPNLGTAGAFTVLGANNVVPLVGTVTCSDTGPGVGIFGQVGTTFAGGPPWIVNAPPCLITGPIITPVAAGVEADFSAALANIDLQNAACGPAIPNVTGIVLPGIYCDAGGTTMVGPGIILTLQGSASDVWVFRTGTGGPGALTLTNVQVVMGGTANPCNVYWKTSAGMTSTDSTFVGTVLSGAAATMTRGSWIGRMMARTDATLTDPNITGCASAAQSGAAIPTLSEWAMIMLAAILAAAGFAAMRRQAR